MWKNQCFISSLSRLGHSHSTAVPTLDALGTAARAAPTARTPLHHGVQVPAGTQQIGSSVRLRRRARQAARRPLVAAANSARLRPRRPRRCIAFDPTLETWIFPTLVPKTWISIFWTLKHGFLDFRPTDRPGFRRAARHRRPFGLRAALGTKVTESIIAPMPVQ